MTDERESLRGPCSQCGGYTREVDCPWNRKDCPLGATKPIADGWKQWGFADATDPMGRFDDD